MNDREQGPEIDVLIGRGFSLKFRSYFTTHCHSYTGKWFLLPGKGQHTRWCTTYIQHTYNMDWTTYSVVYLWSDKKLRHQPASSTLIDLS